MRLLSAKNRWALFALTSMCLAVRVAFAQEQAQSRSPSEQPSILESRGKTSYMKVDITEPFSSFMARMVKAKPEVEKEHEALLNERYDLSDRPAPGVTMDRRKPV